MRIVVLCSSPYSETGCAMAARLAQLGHTPAGAITLPSWDRKTLLRKLGQWGVGESARYAWAKLRPSSGGGQKQTRNPYLEAALRDGDKIFRNLRQVASAYGFPVLVCDDQNSARSIEQLKRWSPDLCIFTGGDILRDSLLSVPRLGVLNAHLALLPEIRGMSSPEWSLLQGVPLGITIHYIDRGIDTGPILLRREFPDGSPCESLTELRNRMIARAIDLTGEAVTLLAQGSITAMPQAERDRDNQFFVMHEALKTQALRRLTGRRLAPAAVSPDE
jgi:folate-dependent phosphoribosylglycinamide formyltransferase PurN